MSLKKTELVLAVAVIGLGAFWLLSNDGKEGTQESDNTPPAIKKTDRTPPPKNNQGEGTQVQGGTPKPIQAKPNETKVVEGAPPAKTKKKNKKKNRRITREDGQRQSGTGRGKQARALAGQLGFGPKSPETSKLRKWLSRREKIKDKLLLKLKNGEGDPNALCDQYNQRAEKHRSMLVEFTGGNAQKVNTLIPRYRMNRDTKKLEKLNHQGQPISENQGDNADQGKKPGLNVDEIEKREGQTQNDDGTVRR